MLTVPERKSLIAAAIGQEPLHLRIDNVQVVKVYTGTFDAGS